MSEAAKPMRLGRLAAELGRDFVGDADFLVLGFGPLESAGAGDLAFVRSDRWARRLSDSRAGALIVAEHVEVGDRPAIRSPNPALDFARAVSLLAPASEPVRAVHRAASVAPDAQVDASASIGAGAVVGARSVVGPGSVLHPNAVVYPDVVIGADCVIHAGVIVREGTRIGDRVELQPGVVLGGDGFGYVLDEQGALQKSPQVGCVVIEDDVEIGANSSVDRATLAETRIRRGAKIDNLVQIAHNCDIGENAIIAGQVGLSGGTVVGRGAILMGQVGSAGHLRIGERAFVGARAGLHRDVPDGARVWGAPQQEERQWHRSVKALARLPDVLRRLRAVERKLGMRRSQRGDAGEDPG